MHDVVILSYARTPFGKLRGSLAPLSAVELGSHAIQHALLATNVSPQDVDHVIMGQVLQAGAGQNPARQAAIRAGLAWETPASTINRVCLSGMSAIIDAYRRIALGEANVIVAGGQESMTNAPHLLPGSRLGWAYGTIGALDHSAHDGLTDAFDAQSMGESTQRHVDTLDMSREDQDSLAALSHQRAAAAQAAGVFAQEIAPVNLRSRKSSVLVSDDEGVRPETTTQRLANLPPAFSADGSITAGNSSPLSDGAAVVVVANLRWAQAQGLTWIARIAGFAQTAGPDNSLHSQPSRAISAALNTSGHAVEDLSIVEINEAFAAVGVQSARDLGIDSKILNVNGGAIALGHPIGASGARIVGHAALELQRQGSGVAAAALCGGGGQGDAIVLTL